MTAEPGGQRPAELDGEAPPQFRRPPVERGVGLVVVAVRAERGTQRRVVLGVQRLAVGGPAVRADRAGPAGPAAGAAAAPVGAGGVHGPEPGGGQGEEHGRVRADGVRHALAAADGARVQQLPHVARVLVRAGRADHRPPVPAPDQQHLVGLGGGRPGLDPAVGVGADEPAAQPDRPGAVPAAADLPLPRLEVPAAGATEHLGEGPGVGSGARTLGRDGHGDPVRMRRGSVVSSRNAR